jgi:hypothetical protein
LTYTTPATVTTGGTSASAQFNAALRDDASALASIAEIAYSSGQLTGYTFPASSTTKIVGMTTVYDSPDGMVDLVNQRIVIRQAGTYRVYHSSPIGSFVRKNGTTTLFAVGLTQGGTEWAFALAVNDYLELWYTNSTGSPVVTSQYPFDAPDGTIFTLRTDWVSP